MANSDAAFTRRRWRRAHPGWLTFGFAVFMTITLWREWPDPWLALFCGAAWMLALDYLPLGGGRV